MPRSLSPAIGCVFLVSLGCANSDTKYAQKILGTWEERQTTREGTVIDLRTSYMPEGKFNSFGSAALPGGEVINIAISGVWHVKDENLHFTVRSSNIPDIMPIGFVHVEKIVSLTEWNLTTQGSDGLPSHTRSRSPFSGHGRSPAPAAKSRRHKPRQDGDPPPVTPDDQDNIDRPHEGPAPPQEAPSPRGNTKMPAETQASRVREIFLPKMMTQIFESVARNIDPSGWQQYLNRLVAQAGDPEDPVEVMLLEQMVLCHLASFRLQAKAAEARGKAFDLYGSMAGRLGIEVRKIALALKEYRCR